MKKISLLCFAFMLCLGHVNAQSSKPQVSTDDSGPWYYVQVLGGQGDTRADRVLAGVLDEETGQHLVFGALVNDATTEEDTDKQLWRFEINENDEYIFINKYFGKQLGIWYWAETSHNTEKQKDVASMTDNTQTRWTFTESATPGYWLISATNPLNSVEGKTDDQKYLHQGNSRWGYRIIMEGNTWGTALESRYQFVGEDDMDMRVLPRSIDFGRIREAEMEDPYAVDTLTVSVYSDLDQDIEIDYADIEGHFYVTPLGDWDYRKGGQLEVVYELVESGSFENVITISSKRGDKEIKVTVPVKGEYIANVPVKISDNTNEHWYYIVFAKRLGTFMADKGENEPIVGQEYVENDESQHWKFVATDIDGEYKIISKAGYELDYSTIENTEEEELDRFVAVSGSDNTFGFDWRTTDDGYWQIKWLQGETRMDDDGNIIPAYINKTDTDDQVGVWPYMPDNGNAVTFIPAETLIESTFPRFSDQNESYWYYVDFDRISGKVWDEVEYDGSIYSNLAQRDKVERATSQYWRFVGFEQEFTIESYSGKFLKVFVESGGDNTYSRLRTVENEGDLFSIEKGTIYQTWQIRNINTPGEGENYYYINDFQGNAVCQYTANNDGNDLNFTFVTNGTSIGNIENGEGFDEADLITNTYYYTIQGVQLGTVKPSISGIYIEKRIHQSGKVSARKLLVTQQ